MVTITEIAARIAELKLSTGTHEFATTWIPAAIRDLETALGWAQHLDRIETANPNQDSWDRGYATAKIAEYIELGERIAREAGAHVPEPTTIEAPVATYTLTYTTQTGPTRHTDLVAARVELMGRIVCRQADRGTVWDIAVLDQAGRDVTFDIPAFRA